MAIIARTARAHEQAPHPAVGIGVGLALALALVLLATWLITRLQLTVAVCALLHLGLLTASAWGREKWARSWEARGSEMAAFRRDLGSEWDHPRIPPDAWRADYPPAL